VVARKLGICIKAVNGFIYTMVNLTVRCCLHCKSNSLVFKWSTYQTRRIRPLVSQRR
jgi:hypothetical protein